MSCPLYWGKSMCGARKSGVYVPPKEVELEYCTTDKHISCPRFREVEGTARPAANGNGDKKRRRAHRGRHCDGTM